jgi:hypothetical protein
LSSGSVTHAFVSAKAQGTDASRASVSAWNGNDAHIVNLAIEYTSAMHIDMRATCTGDGVVDDTTNFATAMTALVAAGGGHVFLHPSKTYLTDRWTLNSAGTTVRFYGGGTLKWHSGTTALVQCSAGRVILDGIKLDGNAISLANNGLGLAYVTGSTAYMEVRYCEITNVGLAASNVGCGITSNLGGKLKASFNNIHDCLGFGIHIQGTGKFDLSHNEIHDCGNQGIFCGPNNSGSTDTISDGGMIVGNEINDIRNDAGGTGQYGNGISLFHLDNVVVGPNNIKNPTYSFVRVNSCSNGSITGVVGVNAGETGIYCELGANNYSITGCVLQGTAGWGISVTNLPAGVRNVVVSGCHVFDFGKTATRAAGIQIEFGLAQGNIIDGNGNAGATWGVSTAPAGLSSDWQSRIESNDVSGCKYDIGVAASSVAGTQRTVIARNSHIRSDANYSSPIGAITGGTSDGGNGSAVGATMGLKYFWDRNYFNVPDAEKPPPGEVGATMKIGGVWKVAGATWA